MLEEYVSLLYEELKEEIKIPEDFIDESIFIDLFFEPFKQAFDGFWSTLGMILEKYPTQVIIPMLHHLFYMYNIFQ